MEIAVLSLPTLQSLRAFVRDTLCQPDRLDPSQVQFFQSPILNGSRPVAILFHLQGPRLLQTSAVWSHVDHRIFFYSSKGTKFLTVSLSESPAHLDTEEISQAA